MRSWMNEHAMTLLPTLPALLPRLLAATDKAQQALPRHPDTHEQCLLLVSKNVRKLCEEDLPAEEVVSRTNTCVTLCEKHMRDLRSTPLGSPGYEWSRWADFATWMTLRGASAAINVSAGGKTWPLVGRDLPRVKEIECVVSLVEPVLFMDLLVHCAEHPELCHLSGSPPPAGWAPVNWPGYVPFSRRKPGYLVDILDAAYDPAMGALLGKPSELIFSCLHDDVANLNSGR